MSTTVSETAHAAFEATLAATTVTLVAAVAAEATKTLDQVAHDAGILRSELDAYLLMKQIPLDIQVRIGAALTTPLTFDLTT